MSLAHAASDFDPLSSHDRHVMDTLGTIADGPAIVDLACRKIRMLAMELGFAVIVDAMHFSRCGALADLDILMQELDSQLRGYMICLGFQSGIAHKRKAARELEAAIGNYKQGRANGRKACEAMVLRSVPR